MPIVTLYETPEGKIGHLGCLLLTQMRQSTTMEFIEALDAAQAKLVASYPKLSSINVLRQSAMKVDEAVRARSVEVSAKYEHLGVGTAIVVLSRGLAGVGVRTALSMFFMLSKQSTPSKVYSNVAEALEWLKTLPGQDPSLQQAALSELEAFLTT